MIHGLGKLLVFPCLFLLPFVFSCAPASKQGHSAREKALLETTLGKGESASAFPLSIPSPRVAYYLSGPQQARPPDGYFEKGIRVRLVSGAGSYSVVESETGVTGYVPNDSLEEPR
jgi:hypothetical protein